MCNFNLKFTGTKNRIIIDTSKKKTSKNKRQKQKLKTLKGLSATEGKKTKYSSHIKYQKKYQSRISFAKIKLATLNWSNFESGPGLEPGIKEKEEPFPQNVDFPTKKQFSSNAPFTAIPHSAQHKYCNFVSLLHYRTQTFIRYL